MSQADPTQDFNNLVKIAALLALIAGGYTAWSFFTSSRYQALCGGSFWELSNKELTACKDMKSELDSKP